jgi:4-amino-4-deoxy-L-arabinose transferase-like glycosyltransferase
MSKKLLSVLFLLAISVYVIGLFPNVCIDAAKYAALSRYIYETGEWLNPHIQGHPYLQKPYLLFWLGALSFKVFGMSMFAFKVPTLLFSFGSIWALYKLASLYYGKEVGKISALVYTVSEMLILFSNDLHTDALLTANIIIGVTFIAYYLEKNKATYFIMGFVFTGLAMISKGTIGLVVVVFAIGGHLLFKREWKKLFSPVWLLAIFIITIVLYPTLKSYYNNFGWEGIEFFLWRNNLGRIQGTSTHLPNRDYVFYLHTLLYIYLPWSFYSMVIIINHIIQTLKKGIKSINRPEYMCYSVIIIYTFLLSVAGQKAPHYLFPVIPFLSIITGNFIISQVRSQENKLTLKWLYASRNIMIPLIWIFLFVITSYSFKTGSLIIWIPVSLGIIFTVYFIKPNRKNIVKLIVPLVISSLLLNYIVNVHFIPKAYDYHGVIKASEAYDKMASDNEELYTYSYGQFETYYYPKKISGWIQDSESLKQTLKSEEFWIITDELGYMKVKNDVEQRIVYTKLFPLREFSRISLTFMIPAKRYQEFKNIYLLKID